MKLKTIAILAVCGIAAACATTRRSDPGDIIERTTVTVDNQSFSDMTVYALRGQRIRLGTSTGHSKTVFTIPAALVGAGAQIRFIADPIGSSRASVSEEIMVYPGDDIGLMIPSS